MKKLVKLGFEHITLSEKSFSLLDINLKFPCERPRHLRRL